MARTWKIAHLAIAALLCLTLALSAQADDAAGLKYYEEQVKPLLAQHCGKCHLDGKAKGGLSLTGGRPCCRAANLDRPLFSRIPKRARCCRL